MTDTAIILTCEITLLRPAWEQSEIDEMDDAAILATWAEDWIDDVIATARMRVRRGDQEGYEYVFEGGSVARVEWSKPREAGRARP